MREARAQKKAGGASIPFLASLCPDAVVVTRVAAAWVALIEHGVNDFMYG